MSSFLAKVEAMRISKDGAITLEEIYSNDPDFKEFIDKVAELLRRFSRKFNVQDIKLYEILFKQVKEEL